MIWRGLIVSVLSLLRYYSAWAQGQLPFNTSIVPSDVEGRTLLVSLGQLTQITFTVTYIPRGIDYHAGILRNKRRFNINNNNLESRRLLSIVSRSCEDSNRPGERCLLLQITVNGTNEHISELNGTVFDFLVIGVDVLSPVYTSGTITLGIDNNECESREGNPCPTGSHCFNTLGSFVCSCGAGYHFVIMNGESQGMCIDVDECTSMIPCDVNARCTNTDGSFSCVCNPGYAGNGKTCSLFNDDNCPQVCDQYCIQSSNIEPFYRICACEHGYYLDADDHTCRDVNECFEGSTLHNCVNAECINTNGSFECDCLPGHTKPLLGGNICEDVDECTTLPAPCHANAICNNTEGSYVCHCQPPYFNTDNSNECVLGEQPKINRIVIKEKPNHNLTYLIGSNFCIEDPMNVPFQVTIVCRLENEPQSTPQFHWSIFYNGTEVDFHGLPSLQVFNESDNMLNLSGTIELREDILLIIACTVDNQFGNDTEMTLIRLCGPFECQDGVTNNCSQGCTRNLVNVTMSYEYKCVCNVGFAANRFGYCEEKPNHRLMYSIGSDFCIEDPSNNLFRVTIMCPLENKPRPPPEFHWSIFYNDTAVDLHGLSSLQVFSESDMLNLSGTIELEDDVSLNITCTVENVGGNDAENTLIRLCGPSECQDGVTNNCSQGCKRNETTSKRYKCDCDLGFAPNHFGYCKDIDECQDTNAHNCSTNAWCINKVGSFGCRCKEGYDGDGETCTFSRKVLMSVISISIVIVFIILTNVTIAGCIKPYTKFKPSTIVDNIRRKTESRSLYKRSRLDKADNSVIQLADVKDYAITVTNPQHVVVKGSVRERLPPGLTIKSSHIRIGESIGEGEYGIVYKGCFAKNSPEVVAIKTLKGFFDENAVAELLTECAKMSKFNNPNVLTVKGVCLDGGPLPYIIMPYMANGSLLSFLKKERANLVLIKDADSMQLLSTKKRLVDMCLQVAKGMEYLAGEGVIHRDLAARNCMIGMDLVIKVADFGLSVNTGNKDYYRMTSDMGIKLPLKWMAPECLTDYIFSEMSDVWAYGVTCWEVFSGGQIPYATIKPSAILGLLQQGERLEMPTNSACSDDIYSTMLWCWEIEPDKRPSFSTLVRSISISLEAMADYLRLGPAVTETETTESTV